MKIQDIKKRMLAYKDSYGQDFNHIDLIIKAKTKKQLSDIIDSHHHFLEMQALDALSNLEEFMNECELT